MFKKKKTLEAAATEVGQVDVKSTKDKDPEEKKPESMRIGDITLFQAMILDLLQAMIVEQKEQTKILVEIREMNK